MQRKLPSDDKVAGGSTVFLLTYHDNMIGGTGHSALYIPKDPNDPNSKPLTLSYNPSGKHGFAAIHTVGGSITGLFPVPGFNLKHGPYKDTQCNGTAPRVLEVNGVDLPAIKKEYTKIEKEVDSGRSLFAIVNSPLNPFGRIMQNGCGMSYALKDYQKKYGSLPEESPITGEYMFPDDYEFPEVPLNNCASQVERLLNAGGVPSNTGMFGGKLRLGSSTPLKLESEIAFRGGKKIDLNSKELPSDIRETLAIDKSIKAAMASSNSSLNDGRMDPNLF